MINNILFKIGHLNHPVWGNQTNSGRKVLLKTLQEPNARFKIPRRFGIKPLGCSIYLSDRIIPDASGRGYSAVRHLILALDDLYEWAAK